MLLSKKSNKILKALYKKEREYNKLPENEKDFDYAKLTYMQIKEMFPKDSYVSVTMAIKFLLEENYINNHIVGSENKFDISSLENGRHKLVLSEKGAKYLEQKNYVLFAKIVPLIISIVSFIISILTLVFNYLYH